MIRKLEKSECRKGERNSFLAYSFPAAQTVRSSEANMYNFLLLACGHVLLATFLSKPGKFSVFLFVFHKIAGSEVLEQSRK